MLQIILSIFQIFNFSQEPIVIKEVKPVIVAGPKKQTPEEVREQINRLRLKMSDNRILRVRRTLTKIDIVI